jgi:hypothetical protein
VVPLGDSFSFSLDGSAETFHLYPTHGRFCMRGIRMFNRPDEVKVLRVTTEGNGLSWHPAHFDAASYNSQEKDYWDAEWGEITKLHPLNITAIPFRDPNVRLKVALYGEFRHGHEALVVRIQGKMPKDNTMKAEVKNTPGELVPLGVEMEMPNDGMSRTGSFYPTSGKFIVKGIKTFNEHAEVNLIRITTQGSGISVNHLPAPADAAAYNCSSGRDYWDADWGPISMRKPLNVTASSFGRPVAPFTLKCVLYGEWQPDLDEDEKND